MTDVTRTDVDIDYVPPAEVEDVELHRPPRASSQNTSGVRTTRLSRSSTGITALTIGMVALVLSWLMRLQLGFPETFSFIGDEDYYQFITMHGMIMVIYLLTALFLGGFGNYLIPLMVGARDMVFPYLNMMSFWVYLLAVLVLVASFFVRRAARPAPAGRSIRRRRSFQGTPGSGEGQWGIVLMLIVAGNLHRRLHHGRPELRHHSPAIDAPAA